MIQKASHSIDIPGSLYLHWLVMLVGCVIKKWKHKPMTLNYVYCVQNQVIPDQAFVQYTLISSKMFQFMYICLIEHTEFCALDIFFSLTVLPVVQQLRNKRYNSGTKVHFYVRKKRYNIASFSSFSPYTHTIIKKFNLLFCFLEIKCCFRNIACINYVLNGTIITIHFSLFVNKLKTGRCDFN